MSEAPRLCLVEDDAIMGESLCVRFELEGFDVDWHRTGEAARRTIGARPYAVVISDIRLPDLAGDQLFASLRESHAQLPPFIFITGFGAIDHAVQLLKLGATDYVTKPFDIEQLVDKVKALAQLFPAAARPAQPVLGVSPAMRRIAEQLPQIARHANTVLITGESGTGKEKVAGELDRLARESARCPFIPVNCGAITESLFESELFGHEKGAFTGASRMKKGYFELADCGTLFLDEIGEMPLPMQVKLLRAIQERKFMRVGGEAPIAVNLRLFCATNRDLRELVAQGRFREDLFYRINVIQIRIPPLRERKEDILWFARLFLDEFAAAHGTERRVLHGSAEQALVEYPWPGNLRELKHAIERACIMTAGRLLKAEDLFEGEMGGLSEAAPQSDLESHLQACEASYIRRTLDAHDWHMGHTAQALGISRKSLWEKMKRLGIQRAHEA